MGANILQTSISLFLSLKYIVIIYYLVKQVRDVSSQVIEFNFTLKLMIFINLLK